MARFFRNPKYKWLNRHLTILLAFLMICYMNVSIVAFGMVKILHAARDVIEDLSDLQNVVNGSVYRLDPITTPTPINAPLGYLDDSGELQSPIFNIYSINSNAPVEEYPSDLLAAITGQSANPKRLNFDVATEADSTQPAPDLTFRFSETTVDFQKVNAYHHLTKILGFLTHRGLDRLPASIAQIFDLNENVPLGDVIENVFVIPNYQPASSPMTVDGQVIQPSQLSISYPYGDRNLYLFGNQANDAIFIYTSFIKKIFQEQFPPEVTDINGIGHELLDAYALFLAYSAASDEMSSEVHDLPAIFASPSQLISLDVKNSFQYQDVDSRNDIDIYLNNVLVIAGALWDLRTTIPYSDIERMIVMAPFLYETGDKIGDTAGAILDLDNAMFSGIYRDDIIQAFVDRGVDRNDIPGAANYPPIISGAFDQTVEVGSDLSFTITVTDPDDANVSVTMGLADSSPIPLGVQFTDQGNGNYLFSWTPSQSFIGSYFFQITAFDQVTPTMEFFTINVTAVNQSPTAVIDPPQVNGMTVTLDGSNSTDSENGPLTYTWDFGDGNTATGPTVTHTYASATDVSNIVLLLKGDNDVSDAVEHHSITSYGNAAHDSTEDVFGGGSIRFDGDGDYLKAPFSHDFNFEDNDFTIDFWAKFNSFDKDATFLSQFDSWSNRWRLQLAGSEGQGLRLQSVDNAAGSFYVSVLNHGMQVGQWHHIALVRSGNQGYLFIDGVNRTTTVLNEDGNMPEVTSELYIGTGHEMTNDFNGFIDELRIAKKAEWTNNFTPPSAPYATQNIGGIGSYLVTLTVSDGNLSDSETETVMVESTILNNVPNAVMATPQINNLDVTFDASASTDPDNDPLTYTWDFGDGNTATGPTVTHTYTSVTDVSNMVLLLKGDNDVSDAIQNHSVTSHGNAAADSAEKVFGDGCLRFDGDGDYLAVSDSPDFNFAGDDFTIDFWVKFNSFDKDATFLSQFDSWGHRWRLQLAGSEGQGLRLQSVDNSDGSFYVSVLNHGMQVGQWHHIALVRSGSQGYIFIDGVDQTAAVLNSTKAMPDVGSPLYFGMGHQMTNAFNGKIDELRITNRAEWTANFTRPESPYATQNIGGIGTYSVTLTVNDGQLSDTELQTVTLQSPSESNPNPNPDPNPNPNPNPQPNQTPTAVIAAPQVNNLAVTFDGSGSSDPDNDPLTYSWNFGDGNTSTQQSPVHNYGTGGNYNVTLTVNDGTDSHTASISVTVNNPVVIPTPDPNDPINIQPQAVISTPVINGNVVDFDGSASNDPNNDPLTYSWDFGDGFTATGPTPTHTYTSSNNVSAISLLIHGDTDVDDEANNHSVSSQGNAAAVSTEEVFGGGSIRFDGDGDYLAVSDSPDFDFGNNDFTIDFWVKFNSFDKDATFLSQFDSWGHRWRLQLAGSEGQGLRLQSVNNSTGSLYVSVLNHGMQIGQWHHIALVRSGSQGHIFIDGVDQTTDLLNTNQAMPNVGSSLYIGTGHQMTNDFNGFIDEIRISNRAEWTTNFTPPSAAYTVSDNHASGNYLVTLTVSDGDLSDTTSRIVTIETNVPEVNLPPTAVITAPAPFGRTIDFKGHHSSDPNNDTLTYFWTFGDGNSSTLMSPVYTYAADGTYNVTLTVSDGVESDTANVTVTIGTQVNTVNTAPDASFTATQSGPLTFDFDASGSTDPENDPLSYLWDFGDNSITNGQTVTHTYSGPGTYTVTLTVSDGIDSDTETFDVGVTS